MKIFCQLIRYWLAPLAIVVIATLLLCAGCDFPTQKSATFDNGGTINYYTVETEGCEYLIFSGNQDNSITHKGNCKNPIHSHNQ